MGINYRQRQRRALRSVAAQSQRTGTRLEQPVPCALGDHKVSIALHPDGSLLSIHSECYDNPPSQEERAVVASLLGEGKFMTCADTVRHILGRVGGGGHIEPGEGFPRDPSDMYHSSGAHALNTVISKLRVTSNTSDRYSARLFRGDHRDAVLLKLAQENGVGEDAQPRWLGHIAGVETRLQVHSYTREDGYEGTQLRAEARMVKVNYWHSVARYLGKGHFNIDFRKLARAARQVPQAYSSYRSACHVCARNFNSVKNHVTSDRHRQRFESVVLDNLITLGSRLYRNQ